MREPQIRLHAEMETVHWWFLGRRAIIRQLVEQVVPPSKGRVVIDVGCGTGGTLSEFAAGYRCIGVDTAPEAIALASRRFPSAEFRCAPVFETLATDGPRADLVLLMDVLEHVEHDVQFLADIVASLRPGSHLLLTVPADMALWSQHDVSCLHYRRYDRRSFERTWAGLPVTARLVSHFNTRLYPIARAVRTWSRFTGKAAGHAETDFTLPSPPVNEALRRIFAGEARVLNDTLQGRRRTGFSHGVSLMAILRREQGQVARPGAEPKAQGASVGAGHGERRHA